jgi:SAM-dependent methyltransferase
VPGGRIRRGSVALWLAGQVASTGRVVATDLDPQFLDGHGRANLEVRKHDLVADPLEEAAFDLAHARTVLEWIPDWQGALERMVSAVRPGGWLVLEDTDVSGVMTPALVHYIDRPDWAALYERIARAVEAATPGIWDGSFGGRLVRTLTDAGLVNIGAEVHAPVVAGEADKWILRNIEFAGDRLVDAGLVSASDIESFLAMSADPSYCHAPVFMVTAWGQRPA